jgi:hypothetical protein
MRRTILALAFAGLLTTSAQAAPPRDVVARVADQIAARYFDAARGERLAAELKAEAARGAYDRYADPLDLAQALTDRLRPADGHFTVVWSKPDPATAAAAPGTAPAPAEDPQAWQNYGFRAVEIRPGGVAVVRMSYFAHVEVADSPAKQAADAVMAMTAHAPAVVFDLRDNGGGSPALVGYLVGHFVPDGADVYNTFRTKGADERELPPAPPKTGKRLDQPVFVAISGRSASAAESFSYTLQAARRAVIVGEPSAGGANPGDFAPVGDGFAVFVSDGSPVNPITGANWEGTGVIPDVAAPAAEALARAEQLALKAIATGPGPQALRTAARWALEAGPAAPAATLADYPGAYGARTVALRDGVLQVFQDRRPPLILKPVGPDLFAVDGVAVPTRITFTRDRAGKVIGMTQAIATGQTARYTRGG